MRLLHATYFPSNQHLRSDQFLEVFFWRNSYGWGRLYWRQRFLICVNQDLDFWVDITRTSCVSSRRGLSFNLQIIPNRLNCQRCRVAVVAMHPAMKKMKDWGVSWWSFWSLKTVWCWWIIVIYDGFKTRLPSPNIRTGIRITKLNWGFSHVLLCW